MLQSWKVNQIAAGCAITLGGFAFGCGLAWSATALTSLEETGQVGYLSNVQKSWTASLLAVGALIASPATGLSINDIGRRTSLIGFSGIGFIGWVLLAGATDPIYLYFGRLLTGISVGGYTTIVPVYVSEISSKENRGVLGSIFVVMLCLGKLFSNGVGMYFHASTASFLCAFHPILYTFLLLFIPESPKLLVRKGKIKEAQDSLNWYETTGVDVPRTNIRRRSCEGCQVQGKLDDINKVFYQQEKIEVEHVTLQEMITTREFVLPTCIVFTQMLLAQFCGINVSTFFTVDIFQFSGDYIINSKHATLILAVIQTIGCLPCSMFVDTYGRKVLSVSAFITMSVSMLGFAIFFYVKEHTTVLQLYPLLGLLPLVCLIVYNLAYSWGVGSVVWIIMSELLPSKIAGPASAISNIIYWGGAFCITKSFQMFSTTVPLHYWFLFFSLVCLFGFIFNVLFLPETKGLTHLEIQNFYAENKEQKEKIGGVV